ncbi:MAG TPA: family 1 glycosylhydrolase [Candidatus Limnocylindria bacterium]|nr:family 1 glycosylhydrolase [Candidatus Limnocylindria bacterium]
MKNRGNFLDVLKRSEIENLLPQGVCAGTASQAVKPGGAVHDDDMQFGFATGIECSNPSIGAENGHRLRRDLLDECGHYKHWREDLQLVKEMNIPFLRYGLPNHRIHLGPDRYDWSFADEALGEIKRLGIIPILDLLHFGVPDWMGDFQNPEMPVHFARYAGAVAERYPWVRAYTPVNEIYVAARNSGLDGIWNERLRTEPGFVTALKHLVAANLLATAAIARHRPNAVIITSESAEYTHHVSVAPSHDIKLRNKLVFVSLDLLYSKAPDADVLMFLQDNGMSREEFMWFMKTSPSGFQIMGNDYYGHNEKLLLPDGAVTFGEDVLGWYLITQRYYRRYYKPVMHTETNTFNPDAAPGWLWKQWVNVLRMRRDGVPVLGFTWYSLGDQVDWDTQLAQKNGRVNACGLFDMERKPRLVAAAYRKLIEEFGSITALAHGEMFEFTERNAVPRLEI